MWVGVCVCGGGCAFVGPGFKIPWGMFGDGVFISENMVYMLNVGSDSEKLLIFCHVLSTL